MKIGLMLAGVLAAAAAIGAGLAIVAVAWVKGGVQPAQMVEIPVDPATLGHAGAGRGGRT